jgi:biopolymer transport protein ExbD
MADIEIKSKKTKQATQAPVKKIIRVDLTPMVDLGFLLITFFVFTTTMAKATVMDIVTPVDAPPGNPVCNSCALTVLLDKDDAVYFYTGAFEKGNLSRSDFAAIREVIQQRKLALEVIGRDKSQFALIIKSSDAARFKNFVDITDEVTINNVKRYYIGELTADEKAAMERFDKQTRNARRL